MKRTWQRWLKLNTRERFIFMEALFLMPWAGFLLRFFRYQKVLQGLERLTPLKAAPPGAGVMARAQRMGELVNIAAWRGLYTATCLRRSLVLWWMLRRRGIDSRVRIGIRNVGGEFSSHAWVEREGVVVNDAADVGEIFLAIM